MPTLETPPNPLETSEPAEPVAPLVSTGRYGALDHSEIVHLLSSLDDEVARSRFRESIYISLIICLALAWFALYGPRVLFHRVNLVPIAESERNKHQMTYLEIPKDLPKSPPPKPTKILSDESHRAQTPTPVQRQPTPEELQAMRRAGTAGQPTPKPQPPQPQPQPQPQPAQQQPRPQPQPQRPQVASALPDAPHPVQQPSNQPSFNSTSPSSSSATTARGDNGDDGLNAPRAHTGARAAVEILSDTQGVDFGPYLSRLTRSTKASWVPLLPVETQPPLCKAGMTLIRFTIQPNGVVSAMHLDDSTRDIAIDKAAWGSITSQGQLPTLPANFKGPLELRFQYNVSCIGGPTAR